ncbi:MAG: amidase, partial [bacterium]
ELSPVEVAEACLKQVERLNPTVNAVVTLSDKVLEEARAAEQKVMRGEEPGPVLGLPVGIKDVTPVAGLRTTYGSPLYANQVPTQDALVVRRLKKAGAIILGKTNTPEFAAGGHTFNEVFGRTCNPWNTKLSPGGSTGGGAAGLATGMFALAEGTDIGGSLRIPASFCGVVGLRPSPGLVPTYPSDYLWDNLYVTGGMGRTAEDVALMLQAVSGPSPLSPISQPAEGRDFTAAVQAGIPKKLRLAYCPDIAGIGIDENIERVCRKAAFEMAHAGAEVEEIELDLAFGREVFLTLRGYWMVAHHYGRLDKIEKMGSNLAGNVRAGLKNTAEQLGAAEQARSKIWQIFDKLFQNYDHLLTPCMAVPPFPVEQNYPKTIAGKKMATYIDWIAPTYILSLTGLPIASVPCGLDKNGLPVGLQIVGRQTGEEAVLALAKVIQDAHPIGLPEM